MNAHIGINLDTERIKSFSVLAASLVTTANAVLALINWNPLPFTDTQAGTAVSMILSVSVDVWAWWRRNIVTTKAATSAQATQLLTTPTTQDTTAPPEDFDAIITASESFDPNDVGDGHIDTETDEEQNGI